MLRGPPTRQRLWGCRAQPEALTSMRKSPMRSPARQATPPSSTDSRYCSAGKAGVGVNSSMGVCAADGEEPARPEGEGGAEQGMGLRPSHGKATPPRRASLPTAPPFHSALLSPTPPPSWWAATHPWPPAARNRSPHCPSSVAAPSSP